MTSKMTDSQVSIRQLKEHMEQISQVHPEHAEHLHGLTKLYLERYNEMDNEVDLDQAVKLAQTCIDQTPSNHECYSERLENLVIVYLMRYQRTENISDLDEVIRVYQIVTAKNPLEHPESGAVLNALGDLYHERYNKTNCITDLDKSIQWAQSCVDHTAGDHPLLAVRLENLAIRYDEKYGQTDDVIYLNEAIDRYQAAIDQTPLDHPQRAVQHYTFGLALRERFERSHNMVDLNSAIHYSQSSVDLTPQNHPERAQRLHILGHRYHDRYRMTGDKVDLDRAVKCAQEAVDETPAHHWQRPERLRKLGRFFQARAHRFGSASDLEISMKWSQAAVDQTPSDHPDYPLQLYSLGSGYYEKYQRTDSISDLLLAIERLEASIELTPVNDSERVEWLQTLGGFYCERYRRMGNISDLETAIKLNQTFIDQIPTDYIRSTEHTSSIQSLGTMYQMRYLNTGNTPDLETAVRLYQMAVDQTSDNDPEHAGHLHSLGLGYWERFRRLGLSADLNTAIKWFRASIEQTPLDYPLRPGRLYNLGLGYQHIYRSTGDIATLDMAIEMIQESVDQTPIDERHYAERLGGLGAVNADKYDRNYQVADLVAAVQCAQESLDQTPLDRPERALRLLNLGLSYHKMYRRTDDMKDVETAIQFFRETFHSHASAVSVRLRGALELIPLYTELDMWELAYEVVQEFSQLIPLLTPRFLSNADKQHLLVMLAGLASDSAAIALQVAVADKAAKAVQLLEVCRGVIFGSLTDLRTDITTLSSEHPELGRNFNRLRDLLDPREIPQDTDLLSSVIDTRSALRYDAQKDLEELLSRIRSIHGYEDFLLAPKEETIRYAAASGPIIIVNVSQYRCDAILIEQHSIRSIPLTDLHNEDVETRARAGDFGSLETLDWMWKTIANPVLEALGLIDLPVDGKWPHIWWIPTRLLSRFPLHAAGRYQGSSCEAVLDRVMSSYSSSIKAILHRRRGSPNPEIQQSKSHQALLVAASDSPGQSSLPFAKKEVVMLRELCETMLVSPVEPRKRKSDVISCMSQCKIFHFAGHGCVDANDPFRSYLLLDDWKSDPLRVGNLLDMSVENNLPFLAYLSACGTGQIKDAKFLDESIHLISAFQLAGFRHVVGTLWEVQDEMCVDVARITYEGIRDGGMTDESVCIGLHNASRKLRDIWLSSQNLRRPTRNTGQPPEARVNSDDDEQEQSIRDVIICDDESDGEQTEERGSLCWVPFVHYGV